MYSSFIACIILYGFKSEEVWVKFENLEDKIVIENQLKIHPVPIKLSCGFRKKLSLESIAHLW